MERKKRVAGISAVILTTHRQQIDHCVEIAGMKEKREEVESCGEEGVGNTMICNSVRGYGYPIYLHIRRKVVRYSVREEWN